jgi:hypothetical protein
MKSLIKSTPVQRARGTVRRVWALEKALSFELSVGPRHYPGSAAAIYPGANIVPAGIPHPRSSRAGRAPVRPASALVARYLAAQRARSAACRYAPCGQKELHLAMRGARVADRRHGASTLRYRAGAGLAGRRRAGPNRRAASRRVRQWRVRPPHNRRNPGRVRRTVKRWERWTFNVLSAWWRTGFAYLWINTSSKRRPFVNRQSSWQTALDRMSWHRRRSLIFRCPQLARDEKLRATICRTADWLSLSRSRRWSSQLYSVSSNEGWLTSAHRLSSPAGLSSRSPRSIS